MRKLCLSKYNVVLQGKEWCSSVPPSSKQASTMLENNESVVSWLSPKDDSGDTEQQIPAILFQGAYWTLSLRMSKSIYRHVRLSQDFQNVQRLHGVQTLRIPRHLLREKQRTQARFEVRTGLVKCQRAACCCISMAESWCARAADAPGPSAEARASGGGGHQARRVERKVRGARRATSTRCLLGERYPSDPQHADHEPLRRDMQDAL